MNSPALSSTVMYFTAYVLPVALVIVWMVFSKRRTWARNRALLQDNIQAGLTEPASLHPLIDHTRCIGCGVCVPACPEGDVLGVIDGKVELINPTQCIGHGVCHATCPMEAITLVFGTTKRGMDIPHVDENFQTNVPGIYIAGELGGMGLIRNAISQGCQAVEAIAKRPDVRRGSTLDVLIVGAGPAGLAAALTARKANLNYLVLEQEALGGTIAHFPRGKLVMTAPFELPGIGTFKFREVSKEQLMELWTRVEQEASLQIHYKERMENIIPVDGGFLVRTPDAEYLTRTILLAIGRRGTPRKLGVPGEEGSTKVVYMLSDPAIYRGKKVLVVGGGNSALEAAVSLSEEPGTEVVLSYRSESFSRAAKKNRDKLAEAARSGAVKVLLRSAVKEIRPHSVVIEQDNNVFEIANDIVIVNAGGVLPTPFLKEIGIHVETKFGTA